MAGTEIAIGAVGAALSVAAGLAKIFTQKAERKDHRVVVTVHDEDGRFVEKTGSMSATQVSTLLDLVDESDQRHPAPLSAELR
jgi:transketolase N-terminal domain/subunit